MPRVIHPVVLAVAGLLLAVPAAPAEAQVSNAYYEFLVARHLESVGDNAGALAALERAAEADTSSAEVRAEIAAFQLRRNRVGEAEAAARASLALDQNNLEGHRVLGLVHAARADALSFRTQRAEVEANAREAIAHLERATSEPGVPTDFGLLFTLGRLYTRIGDSDRAVKVLSGVVTENPNSVQARLALSQAFAAADDIDGAIGTLEPIVEDEPRVASALAQYQEQAGLLDDAVESYTIALAIEPRNRELKFRRIVVLFNTADFPRAATFAREAQEQHPDDLRFPRLQARALFDSGAQARAVSLLEPTARANPRDANTQFAMADLYNDAGRIDDAERTLRRLLDVEPGNAAVLNYLGYLLANHGRQLDEAVRLVERALDADPGNPSYLDSLGWAHFRRGDLDEAAKYLEPAAERMPDNGVVLDHFGDLRAGQGRWQEAIASWMRAIDAGGQIDQAVIEQKIRDAREKAVAR